MFAIRHKKTKAWVYGTDYRYYHDRKDKRRSYSQRTSFERALTYEDLPNAAFEFDIRGCSPRYYEIVEVEIRVKQIEPFFADNEPYYYNSPYKYLTVKEN